MAKNINESIKYLEENYQKEYCLEDLAQAASLSSYHFIRVFKSQTGKAPYEFFMNIKMKKAKEMLMDSSKTITEISSLLGFSSSSHFARVFSRIVGLSPTAYRKKASRIA